MAGRGPAPKDPGHRRRYNQPARGDWIDLEPLDEPILPAWSDRFTVRPGLWTAWRESPVSAQYGPEDIAALEELAVTWERLTPGEQRLRMDGLGLTPKGKRDLRWRTTNEAKTARRAAERAPRVQPLRIAIDPASDR